MKIIKSISVFLLFVSFGSNVNAQEITMFSSFSGNKYYQDDKEIDKKELQALFDKNKEVSTYWKKSKGQELAATIALAAETGFAVWMTLEMLNDDPSLGSRDRVNNALGPALGTLGTGIIGYIFLYSSTNTKKKAILAYNKQFDKKAAFRLVPVSNQNGLGLALKF
ncbi:MAG: hypothetical protein ACR2MT_10870 [Aurantibacter sp.]